MGKVKFYSSKTAAQANALKSETDSVFFSKDTHQIIKEGVVFGEKNNFTSIKVGDNVAQMSGDVVINAEKLGLAKIYTPKGSKETYDDLPLTGVNAGDVWDVKDTGMNYAAVFRDEDAEFKINNNLTREVTLPWTSMVEYAYDGGSWLPGIYAKSPIAQQSVRFADRAESISCRIYAMKNSVQDDHTHYYLIGLYQGSQQEIKLLYIQQSSSTDFVGHERIQGATLFDGGEFIPHVSWDALGGKFSVDEATSSSAGLMSAADKTKLDGYDARITANETALTWH